MDILQTDLQMTSQQQPVHEQSNTYGSFGPPPTLNNDAIRNALFRQSDHSAKHWNNNERQASYFKNRVEERVRLLKQIDAAEPDIINKQLDSNLLDQLRQQVTQDKRPS